MSDDKKVWNTIKYIHNINSLAHSVLCVGKQATLSTTGNREYGEAHTATIHPEYWECVFDQKVNSIETNDEIIAIKLLPIARLLSLQYMCVYVWVRKGTCFRHMHCEMGASTLDGLHYLAHFFLFVYQIIAIKFNFNWLIFVAIDRFHRHFAPNAWSLMVLRQMLWREKPIQTNAHCPHIHTIWVVCFRCTKSNVSCTRQTYVVRHMQVCVSPQSHCWFRVNFTTMPPEFSFTYTHNGMIWS